MSYFVISIVVSIMFYTLVMYMTYISSFILFQSFKYKLILPLVKVLTFVIVCYISIISDVWLYSDFMYYTITVKNVSLTLLAVASLLYARK